MCLLEGSFCLYCRKNLMEYATSQDVSVLLIDIIAHDEITTAIALAEVYLAVVITDRDTDGL